MTRHDSYILFSGGTKIPLELVSFLNKNDSLESGCFSAVIPKTDVDSIKSMYLFISGVKLNVPATLVLGDRRSRILLDEIKHEFDKKAGSLVMSGHYIVMDTDQMEEDSSDGPSRFLYIGTSM